jgi:hypothetical protein
MLQDLAQARMTGVDHAGSEVCEYRHLKVVVDVRQAGAALSLGERFGKPVDLGVRHARLDVGVDSTPFG